MDIIQTIESAAQSAVEAVEHPFHTIGARLKAAGESLATFFGHPYCAPPLQDALSTLHAVVADLAQEVAELRVPCPCKPAPTASTIVAAVDAGQVATATMSLPVPTGARLVSVNGEAVSVQDMLDFREWQAAKASAAAFTGQA